MKKMIMTVAVLACAASVVSAQVTSANIVGYNKDVAPAMSFHIASCQFDGGAYDPNSVYGDSLPVGSKIYQFNGETYNITTYINDYDENFNPITTWYPNTLDLSVGSYWVANNSASEQVAILSGEVDLSESVTNSISAGFQMLSYPYPVAISSANSMDLPAQVGDKIYIFNGSTYNISTYISDYDENFNPITTWYPDSIDLGVGQGFFYSSASAASWVVARPFTP
ncbi:MAG: hypothetical protein JXR25_04560 [Pontiellaceae bacterium]|nr:hypothetical protein [Pontiellaceae bacterium]MBN2784077.1 hypothetical protein [Pontiellaceae bacterium]